MKRLNQYIGNSLLQHILMAVGVLTFVMVSGGLFRAFELLSRGISLRLIGRLIAYTLPHALQFTLPMAVLFATVMVFSRLSADNEITALRASGVSLWQIIAPGLVMAAVLSGVCLWLQVEIAPESRFRARQLQSSDNIGNPLAFLEEGRYIHFPQHVVYVGAITGNRITDVQIYRLDNSGRPMQDIRAISGSVSFNQLDGQLELVLNDAVMAVLRPDAESGRGAGMQRTEAGDMTYKIDFSERDRTGRVDRRQKYMSVRRILSTIYIHNKGGLPTGELYFELHRRMSLAFSPLGFFLIGIPFGIRTKRTETSIGIVVCLSLTVVFYVFLALGESLSEHSRYHPEILVWIPNVIYQIGGLIALNRISAR